ncbi:MAG TPA: hypothetical protein VFS52_20745 [Steroidobacteraceae bacterium]|nr:hypothetical protein [Steroidobacteraceae bacterium]
MRRLSTAEDPTGFLNLFRHAASDRFGDPRGFIQGHGRYRSPTKAGPGRIHGLDYPVVRRNAKGSKAFNSRVMRRGR